MAHEELHEYYDPITSGGANRSRRVFAPQGRYYGFDVKAAPTAAGNVKVDHSALLSYTDVNDANQDVAALVTKHGTVLYETEAKEVLLVPNVTGNPQYQVFYCEYDWAAVPGGTTPTYGVLADVAVEPVTPPTVTEKQVALGYFTIPDGATTWDLFTYTPYPKPYFAGEELDLSMYARLDIPNQFEATNGYGSRQISDTAFAWDVLGPSYTLTLPNTGNVFQITALPSGTAGSPFILGTIETEQDLDGEIFYLQFPNVDRLLILQDGVSPGQISTGMGGDYNEISLFGRLLTLVCYGKPDGNFAVFSPNWAEYHIKLLQTRMTSAEAELNDHNSRLNALEDTSKAWQQINETTPLTFGDWEHSSFYAYMDRGIIHMRGKFTYKGSDASGQQLVSLDYDTGTLSASDFNRPEAIPLAWVVGAYNRTGTVVLIVVDDGTMLLEWKGMDDCSSSNQQFRLAETLYTPV